MNRFVVAAGFFLALCACGDDAGTTCITKNAVRDETGRCECPKGTRVDVSACVSNDAGVDVDPSTATDGGRGERPTRTDAGRVDAGGKPIQDAAPNAIAPFEQDAAQAQDEDATTPVATPPELTPDAGMPMSMMPPACMPTVPSMETCDGIDNDCDGMVDEEVTRPCGIAIAPCKQGVLACHAGKWDDESTCKGAVGPTEEMCDGASKDENCNGVANEGCECAAGATKPCGNKTAPCKQGTLTCTNGAWPMVCVGEVKGSAEVCDDADNDCDGAVDNGFIKGAACMEGRGECRVTGVLACSSGVVACSAKAKAAGPAEVCDVASKDENCNGAENEGCLCKNGETKPCGNKNLPCKQGTLTCANGAWSTACVGEVKGSSEVACDSIDNDCNGMVDDGAGAKNECGMACGVACPPPVVACVAEFEICDDKDNDCDGEIDENWRCAGVCQTYQIGSQCLAKCASDPDTTANYWGTQGCSDASQVCRPDRGQCPIDPWN